MTTGGRLSPAPPSLSRETPAMENVLYELDGHVATITYNRPDALNAINGAMRRDM